MPGSINRPKRSHTPRIGGAKRGTPPKKPDRMLVVKHPPAALTVVKKPRGRATREQSMMFIYLEGKNAQSFFDEKLPQPNRQTKN